MSSERSSSSVLDAETFFRDLIERLEDRVGLGDTGFSNSPLLRGTNVQSYTKHDNNLYGFASTIFAYASFMLKLGINSEKRSFRLSKIDFLLLESVSENEGRNNLFKK